MNTRHWIHAVAALCTAAGSTVAAAQPGDHPAVVVQRIAAKQGYDYASKFYPHPAWLYLLPESPDAMLARRHGAPRAAVAAAAPGEDAAPAVPQLSAATPR